MLKSSALLVCLLGVLAGTLASGASGQIGSNCVGPFACGQYSQWNATCYPTLPPTVFNCNGFYFTTYCSILNGNCPAAAGPAETCTSCSSPGKAGGPISLASGNTYIEENDVRLPGLGGGLTLLRIWNSVWPTTQTAFQIGMFGPNWRSNFEERVFVGGDNYMKYARGDGSFWSFGYNGSVYVAVSPANVAVTLAQGSTYWTLAFQNGEQRLFDNTSGKLIDIVDRNGNTTQLSYDSLGRLVTVTDPASRHLYFSYGTGSGSLVTGVTSDVGLSLSYSYDSQGRLVQYTKTDGTTVSFQFDSNSFISLVTDQNGKVLESHTYDSSGRGLTGSLANGVEAVTINYSN